MAADSTVDPYEPFEPDATVDPTNCPTCRSGFQPIYPAFEEAIKP